VHLRFLLAAILPNLWVIHQFWTKVAAVLLAVTIILCIFQATKAVLEIIIAAKRDRRRSLISLVVAIALVDSR